MVGLHCLISLRQLPRDDSLELIFLQVIIIISGNLSFLNWLTILPSIYCFDDRSLAWLFPMGSVEQARELQRREKEGVQRPIGKKATGKRAMVRRPHLVMHR